MKVKVLVGEYKGFDDYPKLCKELNLIRVKYDLEIISGDHNSLSIRYAKENDLKYYIFKPKWNDMSEPCIEKTTPYGKYNSLAVMKRNIKMINFVTKDEKYRVVMFSDNKDKSIIHMISYLEDNNITKTSVFCTS